MDRKANIKKNIKEKMLCLRNQADVDKIIQERDNL